jgi:hypothetical protein
MVARMRANAGDGSSIPVNIVAFDNAPCAVLRSLSEGDAIALRGSFTPKVWIDRQDESHAVLDVVAQQVLAAPTMSDL